MKKYLALIIGLLIMFSVFTSCKTKGANKSSSGSSLIQSSQGSSLENSEGQGGMEAFFYYHPYIPEGHNFNASIAELVKEEDLVKWVSGMRIWWKKEQNSDKLRPMNEHSVYYFVHDFKIDKNKFIEANNVSPRPEYSSKQIDAIFSDDIDEFNKLFVNVSTIYLNKKLYTPEWIDTHTSEDYEKAGITKEILSDWYATFITETKDGRGNSKRLEHLKEKVSSFEAYEKAKEAK